MELVEILKKTRELNQKYREYLSRYEKAKIVFARLEKEMVDYSLKDKKIHEEHLIEISKYRDKVLNLVEKNKE